MSPRLGGKEKLSSLLPTHQLHKSRRVEDPQPARASIATAFVGPPACCWLVFVALRFRSRPRRCCCTSLPAVQTFSIPGCPRFPRFLFCLRPAGGGGDGGGKNAGCFCVVQPVRVAWSSSHAPPFVCCQTLPHATQHVRAFYHFSYPARFCDRAVRPWRGSVEQRKGERPSRSEERAACFSPQSGLSVEMGQKYGPRACRRRVSP